MGTRHGRRNAPPGQRIRTPATLSQPDKDPSSDPEIG